jgi:hypothetical protein
VGLFVSSGGAAALASRYAARAASILYPYPQPFKSALATDNKLHFMLIRLPLSSVLSTESSKSPPSVILVGPQTQVR